MADQVKVFDSVEALTQYFASLLILHISETPVERAFSWVVSGGSTPKNIFREIAAKYNQSINWNRVKVFWGDERCVAPDDDESNYKMTRENLLDHIPIPFSNIFRIRGEDDPVAESVRYGDLFSRHVHSNGNILQPDLLMLGLGEDGHTASIFPANIHLFNSDNLFEPSLHPVTKQKRVTATGKIINNTKLVIILATGESKASRVAQIINKSAGWDQVPASLVHPLNGDLIWLIDNRAASKL